MAQRNETLSYQPMDDSELLNCITKFEEQFFKFLVISGYPDDIEFFVSKFDLIDSVIRVDKRIAYYCCFHDMKINTRKQAALYAYWILKLRPFKITDIRYLDDKKGATINEAYAIYIICSILKYSKKLPNTGVKKDTFDKQYEDII